MKRAILLVAAVAGGAFGYIRNTSASGSPLYRADYAGVQIWINNQVAGGQGPIVSGSDPVAAARAAVDSWNEVPGTALRFKPLQSTSAGHNSTDNLSVISIADMSDPSVASALNGAVAITIPEYIVSSGSAANGQIIDADILLNPQFTFSTTGAAGAYDLQSVLTHEIGHAVGADHTGIIGASMFQSACPNEQRISVDDEAFATAAYPGAGSGQGTVHGTIMQADGSPAAAALLTLSDTTQGFTIGAATRSDGTYSVAVPPGNYNVYAEPLGAGVVQQADIYSTAGETPAMFQPAMAQGVAAVAAGGSVESDITVTPGAPQLAITFAAVVPAGASVSQVLSFNGPILVNSGQTVDLAVIGPGIDETMDLNLLGRGVHVISIRRDTTVTFGGSLSGLPLIRVTLQIDPQPSAALASLFIAKGANTASYSGILFVTPPVPAFQPQSIVNSADYQGGAVSPGGLYTIFAPAGAANLGPATGMPDNGLNQYGALATSLAGVSVTFDGVPAPLFYVRADMINVQVPFEVAGDIGTTNNATIVVNFDGAASAPVQIPVVRSQPAIFTLTNDGGSDSIIVNQNGNLNSASSPAPRGSSIVVYGGGIGNPGCAEYSLQTGSGAPAPPSGCTGQYVAAFASHAPVSVSFAGWTPTLIGLAQWNIQIPSDAPSGSVNFTLTDTSSGAATQNGTVWIQ